LESAVSDDVLKTLGELTALLNDIFIYL
jgi:hypothetical protein